MQELWLIELAVTRLKHFRKGDDRSLDINYMNLLYGTDMSRQGILYIPRYIYNLLKVKDMQEDFGSNRKLLYYLCKMIPRLIDQLRSF